MALRPTQTIGFLSKAPGPARAKLVKRQKWFHKQAQYNILDDSSGLFLHMNGVGWEPAISEYLWRGPMFMAKNMLQKLQVPSARPVPVFHKPPKAFVPND